MGGIRLTQWLGDAGQHGVLKDDLRFWWHRAVLDTALLGVS